MFYRDRTSSLSLEDLRGPDGDSLLLLGADVLRLHVAVEGVFDLHHLSNEIQKLGR